MVTIEGYGGGWVKKYFTTGGFWKFGVGFSSHSNFALILKLMQQKEHMHNKEKQKNSRLHT